jgi:Mor family transcriptional regulator
MLETLSVEDLPNEGLQYIANTCGMDIAKLLITHCAGMHFDIPLRPNRNAAKRHIELNYDGRNAKTLAREIGMSECFVYKVLREKSSLRLKPS